MDEEDNDGCQEVKAVSTFMAEASSSTISQKPIAYEAENYDKEIIITSVEEKSFIDIAAS